MNDYLLDTQAALLMAVAGEALPKKASQLVLSATNQLFLSKASVWELTIKVSLGKIHLFGSVADFIDELAREFKVQLCDIEVEDIYEHVRLEWHHKDPFDRMIIAQAQRRHWGVLSGDKVFDRYGVKRVW